MAAPPANGRSAPPGASHHSPHARTFADNRFLHHQAVDLEVGVVLGVRDRAFQGLANQSRGLLWAEGDQIERGRDRQTLDSASDFARFERRNLRITICRTNLHFLSVKKVTTVTR